MATARDAADIFGLSQTSNAPRPKKKKKIETTPRVPGINREIQALIGDSVPPVHIVENKGYKKRAPVKLPPARHWGMRQFQHGGRDDGLVLSHWKRVVPWRLADEMDDQEMKFEDEFPSDKWNVKVDIPSYTDEQYEENFKSEEWSREETDYLMDLCRDFDLRWLLIADRYDPPTESQRTTEAMKLRYYTIAAKIMETHTPASNMTSVEFALWEKMRNFDAKTETLRKSMAEKLFERSKDEADEERILLEELHRITKNEEDFIKQRRDLYARLESAPAIRRTERGEEQSTAAYQTSAGLTALLQTLLAKERKFKRPPLEQQQPDRRGQPNQYSRRDTMDSQTDGPQKKGSQSAPNVRTLTPAEEVKFGVSHPSERLTSGIQFRHQKIDRLTMAKSQVQTSKIQAALTQLGIPARLLMPTERVCREFERLVESIHKLLDIRKAHEKTTNEIKILEEMKRIRLGLPKPGEDAMEVDTSQVEESQINESMVEDADGEDDAEGEKDEVDDSMQVDDQDDDAEGEDDEDVAKSAVADEDDEDVDQSYADLGKDDDEEEQVEDEDDDEVAQESSDEDAEDEDDEAGAEVDEGEAEVNESDAGEESEEGEEEIEEQDDDEAEVEASEPEPSRPSSSHSTARVHKRSASVISDASKTGSNRSALGRKKRR